MSVYEVFVESYTFETKTPKTRFTSKDQMGARVLFKSEVIVSNDKFDQKLRSTEQQETRMSEFPHGPQINPQDLNVGKNTDFASDNCILVLTKLVGY